MSSNQRLIDILTRRQIFTQRYSKAEARRLLVHLQRLSARAKAGLKKSYELQSGVAVAAQIARLARDILAEFGDDILTGAAAFAKEEAEFAGKALVNSTALSTFDSPSTEQLLSAFANKPMTLLNGKTAEKTTISGIVRQFSEKKAKVVEQIIRDHSAMGSTLKEVTDAVMDEVNVRTKQQAEAVIRTATNQVGSLARSEVYKANDDVIIGEEYVSVLDSRVTRICASLDGSKHEIGEGPHPPVHWNCRSMRTARINPKYNLGAGVTGKRAAQGGPVSAKTTYGGWLKDQPHSVQDEVLGVERAKLFRSGKISIKSFSDDTGKEYTLEQLKALNPLAFD